MKTVDGFIMKAGQTYYQPRLDDEGVYRIKDFVLKVDMGVNTSLTYKEKSIVVKLCQDLNTTNDLVKHLNG